LALVTTSSEDSASASPSSPLFLPFELAKLLPIGLPEGMTPLTQTFGHFDTVSCTMGSAMGQQITRTTAHQLAIDTPYLLHAMNGVAAEHLCHLVPVERNSFQHRQHRLASFYHWQNALRLFRSELASGANQFNMDALISATMMICVHQFMLDNAETDPRQSFVYAPVELRHGRLQWLTIQHGYKALQQQLGRRIMTSVWGPVFEDSEVKSLARNILSPDAGDDIHRVFLDLCEITPASTSMNNPCYEALQFLLFLRQQPMDRNRFNKLITFVAVIEGEFLELLLRRDKRALLILVHWLAMMHELDQWWIRARCRNECLAITTFMIDDEDWRVRELLAVPARPAGLVLD
jgi:hypothetical protein